ncbi:MAG: GNAT family N-acetyltransferase [Nanoarchaeota archaeon]
MVNLEDTVEKSNGGEDHVVRKATIDDTWKIHDITKGYGFRDVEGKIEGRLIPLNLRGIANVIREEGVFYVAELPIWPGIVAVASRQEYNGIAELRSVATHRKFSSNGYGQDVVMAVLNDTKEKGIDRIYTLSHPDSIPFFKKLGFESSDRPLEKESKDCAVCPIYDHCNEIALVKYL